MSRKAQKQASRAEDARALESGEKTPAQLARENGHFAGLNARVRSLLPTQDGAPAACKTCSKPHHARGYCVRHYWESRRRERGAREVAQLDGGIRISARVVGEAADYLQSLPQGERSAFVREALDAYLATLA